MFQTLKQLISTDHKEQIGNAPNKSGVFPLGRVPNVGLLERRFNNNKINRYLEFQERRLFKHYAAGNYNAIVIIFLMLLKNSISYQILLFHRAKSDWYIKKTKDEVLEGFEEVVNKLRKFDLTLYLNRFYVIKNKIDSDRNGQMFDPLKNPLRSGEKLRPIGSPDLASAVISKAFTNIITFLFENDRGVSQHGYRPGHGVYSALFAIIKKYKENKDIHIMEFDFKSYFNKVSIHWVRYKLEEKSKVLSELVGSMLLKIVYIFNSIQKENELSLYGAKQVKLKNGKEKFLPLILRSGLPQGLSMSPLLSTLAMEFATPHPGLVMYADDGLFLSEDPEEFYFYMESLGGYGVSIEDSKTKVVDKAKDLKFLGCIINFDKETIKYKDMTINFNDEMWKYNQELIERQLKVIASMYGKKPYAWEWEVNQESYLEDLRIPWNHMPIFDLIITYIKSLWNWSSYKGIRYISGRGFYDIIHSSSYAINLLIQDSRGLDLKKKGLIKIPVFNLLPKEEVRKQGYIETFYEVDVLFGTNNFSEHIELVNLEKRKIELGKI